MARVAGGFVAAALVLVLAVLAIGAGDGGGHRYLVRAIFDNAVNVIPGEDVKIAGVKVGTISSLHVVDNRHAAIVLDIQDPGFQDFRADASCTINAQSLIGEKFVACSPTRPTSDGQHPPPLRTIPAGQPGAGERLLPLANTSSPVDPDLIANIMREPGPQRLRVILNELGIALGARGEDLRTAIRRADPALKQTGEVLQTLAGQNRTLANLATDADAALAPLARQRDDVTGAIRSIGATAAATASRRAALAASFQRFPAFLRELIPTTDRLGALADAGTPLAKNLRTAAPGLNELSVSLKPFAQALGPWFTSLGKTAESGTKAVVEAKPAIDALTTLATDAGPTMKQLGGFLGNLRYAGGIENFLDLIYNTASATNGFDDVSHFIRGTLIVTACATYAITPASQCNANFIDDSSFNSRSVRDAGGAATADAPRDAGLLRAAMVLNGSTPAQALSKYPDPTLEPAAAGASSVVADPAPSSSSSSSSDARGGALLNYLLAP